MTQTDTTDTPPQDYGDYLAEHGIAEPDPTFGDDGLGVVILEGLPWFIVDLIDCLYDVAPLLDVEGKAPDPETIGRIDDYIQGVVARVGYIQEIAERIKARGRE